MKDLLCIYIFLIYFTTVLPDIHLQEHNFFQLCCFLVCGVFFKFYNVLNKVKTAQRYLIRCTGSSLPLLDPLPFLSLLLIH